jgi:hypothetical protein
MIAGRIVFAKSAPGTRLSEYPLWVTPSLSGTQNAFFSERKTNIF